MNTKDELDAFFERVPEHVLVVVDQAYFEYIDRPDYPDAVEAYVKRAGARSCCAPSRRSTGSPGLRVGYAVGAARRLRGDDEDPPAVRPDDDRAGRGAREPRRSRRDRPAPRAERRGSRPARRDAARPRARARRGRGRQLPLRGHRRGRRAALRAAAARGRDRAAAARLRRADGDPRLGRHARRERVLRRRARPVVPACRAFGPSGSRRSQPCGYAAVARLSADSRFRLLFFATLRLRGRQLAGRGRAPDRRLRPDALRLVGRGAARREHPARRSSSGSCSARSSTGSRARG